MSKMNLDFYERTLYCINYMRTNLSVSYVIEKVQSDKFIQESGERQNDVPYPLLQALVA